MTTPAVTTPDTTPDVTVVVASRNRRDELLATLPRHEAPVVLVDNASTDGSADAVEAAAFPHVRVVRCGRNLAAAGRTLGTRLATTRYVAFADDDSWWAPGALARAAEVLDAHPGLALLQARILVGPQQRTDPVCEELAASPLPSAGLPGPRLLGFVACAAMVRRDAFLAVGGFDDVVRFPGEEERVALDLAAAGWDLAYVDDVVVHHHPSPAREDAAARAARVSRSRLLTAVLRRPWPVVAREVRAAVAAGPVGRAGLRTALPDVPAALRARRRLPDDVEHQLALLAAPAPAAAQPTGSS
ncbi:MAG: glycosyltransferase family 2 protein [Actinomycetota bacterium]